MAELNVETMQEGVSPSYVAPQAVSASDVMDNDGQTVLFIKNDSGGDCLVTAVAQTTSFTKQGVGRVTRANNTLTVANGTIRPFGPFSKEVFNDAAGQMTLTFGATTSVTVQPVSVPGPGQYGG